MMSASLAPPLLGGSSTFSVAAWSIHCRQGNGLTFVAKGLAKMGVRCVVLLEMNSTNNPYACTKLGYKVFLTKAPNKHQGGIALLWQLDHEAFEVEAARIVTPNFISFQLVTDGERYYIMGIYISPHNTEGGEDLWVAWEVCLANCTPLVMGNLNINVEHPRDKWEATIANMLDKMNLVDTSRKFTPWRCSLQRRWLHWTWCQKHRGCWIYSQLCCCHVLQGSGAVCAPLWEQDVEPDYSRACTAGRVPHPCRLQDGTGTQTLQGFVWEVGIPLNKGRAQAVWPSPREGLH